VTTRLRDWQSRLSALLAERRHAPFAWGANDCWTFAADCVVAISGHDPAKGLRSHQTAVGASKSLAPIGSLPDLADARLGARIAPALAQAGDIGLAMLEKHPTYLVCVGDAWVGPGEDGLLRLPRDTPVYLAWRAF
jgi:hypothetical protein